MDGTATSTDCPAGLPQTNGMPATAELLFVKTQKCHKRFLLDHSRKSLKNVTRSTGLGNFDGNLPSKQGQKRKCSISKMT